MNSAAPAIITKTFEYKIRHTAEFTRNAVRALDASREVYNAALEHRISRYRQGKPVGYFEQSRELTEARTLPHVSACLRAIQEDALKRLDLAFGAFFRRLKNGERPGFPRFKSRSRYSTFSQKIESQRACPLAGDRLKIPGVGSVRVRLSRPIEGTVKQIRITHRADGWYALLVCDLRMPVPLGTTGKSVGVDMGLESFATLSNGEAVANPRHLRRATRALKRSQQALSRKARRSANRTKARQRLALMNLRVKRARRDFHHKAALDLVRRFDRIVVEDLAISKMMQTRRFAHSIGDAGWGQFTSILACKAEWAGREFVKVDPRYTSQTCSACGHRHKMPLALRLFECGSCGHVLHRDVNAAINIGRGAPESKPAVAAEVLPASGNRQSGSATTAHPDS